VPALEIELAGEIESIPSIEGEVQTEFSEDVSGKELDIRFVSDGVIAENLNVMESQILEEVNKAIIGVKDGDIAESKRVVGYANKLIKDMEQRRIFVKREYSRPVDRLYKRTDEIIEKITKAMSSLTLAISEKEKKDIEEKNALITSIKNKRLSEEKEEIDAYIRKCAWFNSASWMNKGFTEKKIIADIDEKVKKIVDDLNELDTMNDGNPNAAAIAMSYQKYGVLSQALAFKRELEREDDARKVRVEANKKAEDERNDKAAEDLRRMRDTAGNIENSAQPKSIGNSVMPSYMASVTPSQRPREESMELVQPPVPSIVDELSIYNLKIECSKNFLTTLGDFLREQKVRFKLEISK
jgi:hypothetical protein